MVTSDFVNPVTTLKTRPGPVELPASKVITGPVSRVFAKKAVARL